jgi:hypothetical protein
MYLVYNINQIHELYNKPKNVNFVCILIANGVFVNFSLLNYSSFTTTHIHTKIINKQTKTHVMSKNEL